MPAVVPKKAEKNQELLHFIEEKMDEMIQKKPAFLHGQLAGRKIFAGQ